MDAARDHKWSLSVRNIYNGRCIHCNVPYGGVHHIIPRNCQRTRYVIENGIFCCDVLHRMFEGKHGKTKDQRLFNKKEAIRIYVGKIRHDALNEIKFGHKKPSDYNFVEII